MHHLWRLTRKYHTAIVNHICFEVMRHFQNCKEMCPWTLLKWKRKIFRFIVLKIKFNITNVQKYPVYSLCQPARKYCVLSSLNLGFNSLHSTRYSFPSWNCLLKILRFLLYPFSRIRLNCSLVLLKSCFSGPTTLRWDLPNWFVSFTAEQTH